MTSTSLTTKRDAIREIRVTGTKIVVNVEAMSARLTISKKQAIELVNGLTETGGYFYAGTDGDQTVYVKLYVCPVSGRSISIF